MKMSAYQAFYDKVVWRDLSSRGKLKLEGPDRVTFLHALITQDVTGLNEGQGRQGMLLTATGKIVADFNYYRLPESILIDVARIRTAALRDLISNYIIMDDVTVEDLSSDRFHFSIEGPAAPELLGGILESDLPSASWQVGAVEWRSTELLVIRRNELSEAGFEVIGPASAGRLFNRTLLETGERFGLVEMDGESWEALRLERGIPIYGLDMDEKNNPVQVGNLWAYSLTKGCYPGQEVVAKATNLGGVSRRLVRLTLEGDSVPSRRDRIRQSGQEVGWITSAAWSPKLESVAGLGYVKRAFTEPGTRLEVVRDEGVPLEATVDGFPTADLWNPGSRPDSGD
jgi:folate-binding protein YgfZ